MIDDQNYWTAYVKTQSVSFEMVSIKLHFLSILRESNSTHPQRSCCLATLKTGEVES